MIPRRLFADVWELLFRTKRMFRTFFGKVHFPAPKRPKCSSPYVFPGQINDLGTEKCTFSKKVNFLHFFHFGHQKVMRIHRPNKGDLGDLEKSRTFCSKVHFGSP